MIAPPDDADAVQLGRLGYAQELLRGLAYRPRPRQTDVDRNLISNIHPRGVSVAEAGRRIANLLQKMREVRKSGVDLKE